MSARQTLLLVVCAALLLLPALGMAPLFDLDEGAFSEATREMLAHHHYLATTLNGEPRWDKPILIYWLQALSILVFGLTPFAFRLPSALAGLATSVLVARFAARELEPAAEGRSSRGLLAGLLFLTSLGPFVISHAATADALLQLCLCGAAFALWEHYRTPPGRSSWQSALRLYAWMGVGLLAKGPVAMLVPGAAGVILYAGSGRFRDGLRLALWWPGWLALLAIAGPWYAAVLWRYGMAFVNGFLVHHNLERFAGPMQSHGGSLFYYFPVLLLLGLPYTGAILAAFRSLPHLRADPFALFLWGWFLFVFVFFSLSGTKLPHYLLYGFVPLLLLTVRHGDALRSCGGRLAVLAVPVLWLLLWLAVPLWLHARRAQLPPLGRFMLEDVFVQVPAAWVLLVSVLLLAYLLAAWRFRAQPLALLAGSGVVLAAVLGAVVLPFLAQLQQGPLLEAARFAATRPEPLVQWGVRLPSVAVALRREVPVRAPRPGEIALVRRDKMPPQVEVLFAEHHLAIVKPVSASAK